MTSLSLTLTSRPAQNVDLSPLTPDRLQGKTAKTIKAMELVSGNRKLRVADLFTVSGNDADQISIHRSCDKLCGIGAQMATGHLEVHGTAGDYLGQDMQGGLIKAHGAVGAWAAAGMKGGLIEVFGNAGDFIGAARPGAPHGMSEGTVIITGNAGDRIGDRMRGGMLIIRGNAGEYCGSRMLAGTILVLGHTGDSAGLGMKRGTIVLANRPQHIASTFNSCGRLKVEFLRLLWQQLGKTHRLLSPLKGSRPDAERFAGDLAWGGKGEILVLQPM